MKYNCVPPTHTSILPMRKTKINQYKVWIKKVLDSFSLLKG
jgi:hypothetical protein